MACGGLAFKPTAALGEGIAERIQVVLDSIKMTEAFIFLRLLLMSLKCAAIFIGEV